METGWRLAETANHTALTTEIKKTANWYVLNRQAILFDFLIETIRQ
jgi:hypothetical protein